MSGRMNKLWVHQNRAGHRYATSARLSCDLLLVRAAVPYQWLATKMDDPNYGWSRYISGRISSVTIPGQHTDLFAPTNESLIAEAVAANIARHTGPKAARLDGSETAELLHANAGCRDNQANCSPTPGSSSPPV
jgi:hypothetical protein